MANDDFISSSNFKVKIEGMNWDTFESVSGVGVDVEDIPFQTDKNSIENRPGRSNARDIILTRRFKKDKELYSWMKDVQNGKINRKSGSVALLDDEGKEIVRFNFENSWPKSWTPPTLSKAIGGNDTPMETIVLSVGHVEMV
jgi:phage tail-like protein